MYRIDVCWENVPTGIRHSDILWFDCDYEDEKFAIADEECYNWYVESATEIAIVCYKENRLDLEGVDLSDYVDEFLEDCIYCYSF